MRTGAVEDFDPVAIAQLQARLRALREGSAEWTMAEFLQYLRFYKRRGAKTANNYRRQLAFMSRHPTAPVKLHGTRAELIESFFLYVAERERVDLADASALKGDHQAVRALGSFLQIPENVWPTAPAARRMESRWVPSPEQVFELLHAHYGPRNGYEANLVRYMLAYSFGLGVRPPSEILSARVGDVDLEHGIIVIEETKKSHSRRELLVRPTWLVKSPNRLSLATWVQTWRPRCNPDTDALFPNLDGLPFPSTEACSRFLVKHVRAEDAEGKPTRAPWYVPYLARHWSCNARLIESARTIDGQRVYDWNAVSRWHGHDSPNITMNTYARAVEVNEHRYGNKSWLTRAFGRPLLQRPAALT